MLTATLCVRIGNAAAAGAVLCMLVIVAWGVVKSMYLLRFDPERASASIGLGDPISAGMIAAFFGFPHSIAAFVLSCFAGFAISAFQRLLPGFSRAKGDERRVEYDDIEQLY